jgi:SAM-dependent methyltransferase
MSPERRFSQIKAFFDQTLDTHGPTPRGVDYNSLDALHRRYEQLLKVCNLTQPFTLIDYGCGYGAMAGFMASKGFSFHYFGYDISEKMIAAAREMHQSLPDCVFTTQENELPAADYIVESGIFNKKFDAGDVEWRDYIQQTLTKMNELCTRGMAFNLLTKYSDPDRMRPDLYYADPCFFFDFCKTRFSRNVALLHDYELYDFTILVRK